MILKHGEVVLSFILIIKHVPAKYFDSSFSGPADHTDVGSLDADPLIVLVSPSKQQLEVGEDVEKFDDVFFVTGADGVTDEILIYDDDAKEDAKNQLYKSILRTNPESTNTEEIIEDTKKTVIRKKLATACLARDKCETECDKEKKKYCQKKCVGKFDKYNLCEGPKSKKNGRQHKVSWKSL